MARDIEISGKAYRGRLEIIKDILIVVADAGEVGSRKTHVMYGANLSDKLLMRYLDVTLHAGLVYEEGSWIIITQKGKEFLEFFKQYENSQAEIKKHSVFLENGRKILEKLTVS